MESRQNVSHNTPTSNGYATSFPAQPNSISSGAASAWNIAFNDLKRRYRLSQNNVFILKEEKEKLKTKHQEVEKQLELFKTEISQLKASLQTKNRSYDKLEDLYNEQREYGKQKELHAQKLFENVLRLGDEKKYVENELQNALDENTALQNEQETLSRANKQLEQELDTLKNIPEVTISKDSRVISNSNSNGYDKTKDMLISENKALKTNVHWLSDELKKLKTEQYSHVNRPLINGCLEEGINTVSHTDGLNFASLSTRHVGGKQLSLRSYIALLHRTVHFLKASLLTQNRIVKGVVCSTGPNNSDNNSGKTLTDSENNSATFYSCENSIEYSSRQNATNQNIDDQRHLKIPQIYEDYEREQQLLVSLRQYGEEKKDKHRKGFPHLVKKLRARIYAPENHVPNMVQNMDSKDTIADEIQSVSTVTYCTPNEVPLQQSDVVIGNVATKTTSSSTPQNGNPQNEKHNEETTKNECQHTDDPPSLLDNAKQV